MKIQAKRILEKKEFKKLRTDDVKIIGYLRYSKKIKESCEIDTDEIKKKIYGRTICYVDMENNEYICVKDRNILIILLLILFGLLLSGMFVLASMNKPESQIKTEGEMTNIPPHQTEVQKTQEAIYIPTFYGEYTLNKENPYFYLENLKINDVYFKYTLCIDEVVIFTTDYIKPGNMKKVNLYELLDKGSYNVVFLIETLDIKTQRPDTTTTVTSTVIIE